MIRYAIILIAAMGTFAGAAAFHDSFAGTPVAGSHPTANQTIVAKNSAFPVIDTQGWIACKTDDCSDVPAVEPNE